MSDGQGSGGPPPPQDDRTLLDPLNAEELRALREARVRVQPAKGSVAHQVVVGPDTGPNLGEAPTRATPSLPSFDSRGSLDAIRTPGLVVDSVSARRSDPASGLGLSDPAVPSVGGTKNGSEGAGGGRSGTFGENTLLWMQPPKIAREVAPSVAVATGDLLPRAGELRLRRLKTVGLVAGLAALAVGLLLATSTAERGVIEIHSNPAKARVVVGGHRTSELAPVKLTLPVGEHEIRLELDGHKPKTVRVNVGAGDDGARQDIDLEPISEPGLMTVAITVEPVSARISVNGVEQGARRSIMVPNLDPKKSHRIVVESAGYVRIEQEVAPEQLKASYTFVLQADVASRLTP